jgi:hypothetical protein
MGADRWTSHSRPLRGTDVLSQQAGDALVLLNLLNGKYFTLESVGRRIWELSDGMRSLEEIIAAICTEYQADPDVVRADARELLGDLGDEGLVVDGAGPERSPRQ